MTLAQSILARAQHGEPRTTAGYILTLFDSPWTPERDALLVRLRDSGLSFGKIADRMGASTAAVSGRYTRIKRREAKNKGKG